VDYALQRQSNGYVLNLLTGSDQPNGLGLSYTKRGPLSAVDCSDPQGYRGQISIPDVVRDSDQPARICSLFSDKAGNLAQPATFDFGPPALLPNAVANSASGKRGTVAPGSIFRVDTFNLTLVAEYSSTPAPVLAGVRLDVRDSAGRTLPVAMTSAGPLTLEAVMPDTAAPGPATIVVHPPQGPLLSLPFSIRSTAPALFPDGAGDAPRGFAWDSAGHYFPLVTCPDANRCSIAPVSISSAAAGLDFVLYATGLRGATGPAQMKIGTYTIGPVEVRPHATIPGLDEVRFHLPSGFPLRLFQTVQVETSDGISNYLWIYLQ
jgi:uncharacterized protein (TIGR03437 family)